MTPDLADVETEAFDNYKARATGPLAPEGLHLARVWHFVDRNTTAIAWFDVGNREQVVFLNGLQTIEHAITAARALFEDPSPIPSALTLRFKRKIKTRKDELDD